MRKYKNLKYTGCFSFLVFGCCALMGCTQADREKISNIDISFPKFTSLSLNHKERAQYIELKRKNNAAADVLSQKASNRMDHTYKIKMLQLVNLGEPLAEGTPTIEWLIPQQVGQRFSELGFNVEQPMKAPVYNAAKATGTLPMQLTNSANITPHNHPHRHAGSVYIEGEYAYLNDELLVTLRLVGGRTNNILSSISYDMDVDADLYQLLDPRATDRIFGSGWMQ